MNILGISAFYHDSAAALIKDGNIVAAVQEERFSRIKHDASYPKKSVEYCLAEANLLLEDVDHVVFYDKPLLKFERLLKTYIAYAPQGYQSFSAAMAVWLKDKLFQKRFIRRELSQLSPDFDWNSRLLFSEHHRSHAASAFYPSPFDEALVLTMDGVGEWATTSVSLGEKNQLEMLREIHFPHSLGLLYSAFTSYTGFKVNSGEYKVMGLAPYGQPKYVQKILNNIIDLKDDGSFRLNMHYFDYCTGLQMTNQHFDELFGSPRRQPEEELKQFHMDIAASIQQVTEIVVLRVARALSAQNKSKNLCLAGGVALNCVANGKLIREKIFENIWVQPAAGDAGGALGAALDVYHSYAGQPRSLKKAHDAMKGSYLGPSYTQAEIEEVLKGEKAVFKSLEEGAMLDLAAGALATGKIIGWHQGRMEFGPRALGARSILGNPCSSETQKVMNLKIKYRESFRPFAPSILAEHVSNWFEHSGESPYMLVVADVVKEKRIKPSKEDEQLFGINKLNNIRSEIPAVTHVDYSARIQTVHKDTNPKYHALIERFYNKTGCPIVVNTSFNVRGEPIVSSPADAFRCFMGTEMDVLVIGNCVLIKEDQDSALLKSYKDAFELD